jgi:hypothetical protein
MKFMHTTATCPSVIPHAVVELLSHPRQRFGFHVTITNGSRDFSITASRIELSSSAVEAAYEAAPLLAHLEDFGLAVKSVDAAGNTLHICSVVQKTGDSNTAVLNRIHAMQDAWGHSELERYQAHRVEMGLLPLQPGERRSHWDEPMRLAYREKFGAHRYVEVRAETLRVKQAAFAAMKPRAVQDQAAQEEVERRAFAAVTHPSGMVLEMVPRQHFADVVHKLLELYTLYSLPTVVSDASSGNCWQLSASGSFQRCAYVSGECAVPLFLPRLPSRTAAQQLAGNPGARHALSSILLADADIETMTRRFYGGKTFLFYTLQQHARDKAAMHWAFNSDVDGEATARNVFFVLAQVMYSLNKELEQAPEDPATRDIHTFMTDLWNLTFVSNKHFYSKTNSFLGLRIEEFIGLLKQ